MKNQISIQRQLNKIQGTDISQQIENLLEQYYLNLSLFDNSSMEEHAKQSQEESYIKLTGFVPPVIENAVREKIYTLLDNYSMRKEIFVKATGNTPRFMETFRRVSL